MVPYEGEFAGYRSLRRIVETERVKDLLGKARTLEAEHPSAVSQVEPVPAPNADTRFPDFVVAIDGSPAYRCPVLRVEAHCRRNPE